MSIQLNDASAGVLNWFWLALPLAADGGCVIERVSLSA
jgi:hypothetical protein